MKHAKSIRSICQLNGTYFAQKNSNVNVVAKILVNFLTRILFKFKNTAVKRL